MHYIYAALIGAVGGGVAFYFIGRLPLKAKLKQVETIIATELHAATPLPVQHLLQRIAKAL